MEIDPELVIPDRSKSVDEGAVAPWNSSPDGYYYQMLKAVLEHFGCDTSTPFKDIDPKVIDAILYGSKLRYNFIMRADTVII